MINRHIQPSPEMTLTAAESSDSTPTRTTMVTLPTPELNPRPIIPKVWGRGGIAQCTHLTMTRLYGRDIRCQVCLRQGSFGWVYRCTQDREVLLEDEIERGLEDRMDCLSDIFERASPRKRGPQARSSRLAFLDEVTDEQMRSYTAAQLNRILTQRAQVLEKATTLDFNFLHRPHATIFSQDISEPSAWSDHFSTVPPPGLQTNTQKKPWLPKQECQFRCCHTCRNNLGERAYLSLNSIANGDIPPTAITGYGFHVLRQRPVVRVELVENLGLRPVPLPRPRPPLGAAYPSNVNNHNIAQAVGLGILAANDTLPPLITETVGRPSSLAHIAALMSAQDTTQATTQDTTTTPQLPPIPPSSRRHSTSSSSSSTPKLTLACLIPLPPSSRRHSTSSSSSSTPKLTLACLIPLPPQTAEEISTIEAPLTPMEEHEKNDGAFGSGPLEVNDGVAMMEESVEFHVADLVTQF